MVQRVAQGFPDCLFCGHTIPPPRSLNPATLWPLTQSGRNPTLPHPYTFLFPLLQIAIPKQTAATVWSYGTADFGTLFEKWRSSSLGAVARWAL